MNDVLLRARALEVGFGRKAILPPIDVTFGRCEIWGLIGRNGSGKTTLLRTVLGLDPPVRGVVERPDGVTVGYVPQRHALDPLIPARAKDLITEGADRGWSFVRPLRTNDARAGIARAIEATSVQPLLGRRYCDLSEGEKQRVLLARALAGGPDLLVLDEPTSAMDLVAERQVTDLLASLRSRLGIGVILVTHHIGLLPKTADRLLFLDADDHITVAGPVGEVLAHPVFARRYGAVITEEVGRSAPPPPPANTNTDGRAAEEAR